MYIFVEMIYKRNKTKPTVNTLSPVGGPKDPQLSISLNALKQVCKRSWNVFDFSYIDFHKIFNQKY